MVSVSVFISKNYITFIHHLFGVICIDIATLVKFLYFWCGLWPNVVVSLLLKNKFLYLL